MRVALTNGCAMVVLALLVAPTALAAGPVIDGLSIPSEFGAPLSVQRFQTGFGDDTGGDQWGWGSELDALYITNDAQYLYVGLTGNLENNGNSCVVFIDIDQGATGENWLSTRLAGLPIGDLPRFLAGDTYDPGFDNIVFDPNFAANYALGWSGGSPLGSQTRTYYLVNWTELGIGGDPFNHDNEVAGMITTGDPTASGPSGTLGSFKATASLGILGAADNTNTAGVEGTTDPNAPCPLLATGDPTAVTTGFEFAIPLSLLGVGVDDKVCLFAMVSSPSGWMSNQLLPPGETETDFCNIGNRNQGVDMLEFSTISGEQYVCYTVVEDLGCPNPGGSGQYCAADIDGSGDCIVSLADLQILLSSYGKCPGDAGYVAGANLSDDGDDCIKLADLQLLLSQYGDDCN